MTAAVLGFLLGVCWLQRQAVLPAAGWLWLGVPAVAACALLLAFGRGGLWRTALLLACAALAGALWATGWAQWRMDDRLAPGEEGRDLEVVGVVAGLPAAGERSLRFEFEVEAVEGGARLPRRVLLSWYRGVLVPGLDDLPDALQEGGGVQPGERWRFNVRLKRPHGGVNPHGFDYEAWLLERGIGATGYVRPPGPRGAAQKLGRRNGFIDRIERARGAVRERFLRVLGEPVPGESPAAAGARATAAGVLVALAVGDQRAIDAGDWMVFNRTGVTHLMSISGLHVTLVSGLVAALVSFGWRRAPALALALPARKAAAVAAVLAALGYALVAGFAVPAQRTCFMVAVVAAALWAGRIAAPVRVLALALFAVLLLDPWAVLAAGFWLSFGAVGLIFYVAHGWGAAHAGHPAHAAPATPVTPMARLGAVLHEWGRTQWAITLGLAPAALLLFGQVSLVGPLANAVAIPLVSGVITPLALLAALLPIDALLHLAAALMRALMVFLVWCAWLPAAVWQQAAPPPWAVPLALAGVLWMLAPHGLPARWLGCALLLPAVLVVPPRPAHGEAWIDTLDVGQGLAVLVRTRAHALLYDAGPAWGEADSGERVILPVLRALGVPRLDRMLVTHNDLDHTGGAISVLDNLEVGELLSSLPAGHPVLSFAPRQRPCLRGERWDWDGVRFEVLHPAANEHEARGVRINDLSCVLRVAAGEGAGGGMLLTGDIEKAAEARLLAREPQALRAQVLLAPHHGSGTSSTAEFLAAVGAREVVVAAGYRNRFGHPKAEVLARYAALGARVSRTDRDGAVQVRLDAQGAGVSALRHSEPRYWRSRAPPVPGECAARVC